MAQVKLINCEEVNGKIKLTFIDQATNKETTGIYTNGNLNLERMRKLIGSDLSIEFNEQEMYAVRKAWDEDGRPNFCDDGNHGFDR